MSEYNVCIVNYNVVVNLFVSLQVVVILLRDTMPSSEAICH
jgi:hypothetical protein